MTIIKLRNFVAKNMNKSGQGVHFKNNKSKRNKDKINLKRFVKNDRDFGSDRFIFI